VNVAGGGFPAPSPLSSLPSRVLAPRLCPWDGTGGGDEALVGLYGGTSVNFGTLISSRTIFSLGGEEVSSGVLFLLAGVPRLVFFYLAAPANLNLDMGFPLLSR